MGMKFAPGKEHYEDQRTKHEIEETDELVSIIIPTYNRERYIDECIDSALKQSYRNLEVIVIDDGSTDGTRKICDRYGEKIRYFYKPNGGTASALNMGICKMRGSWLITLGSDDTLIPDAVETLIKVAKFTLAEIVSGNYIIIDENGNKIKDQISLSYHYHILASKLWLDNGCPYALDASILHKSCLNKVGLFNEKVYHEDFDWWLRAVLLHKCTIIHTPHFVSRYRIHGEQKTKFAKVQKHSLSHIKDTVKQQIISADEEWWRTLSSYRIRYQWSPKRLLFKAAMMLPEEKRTPLIRLWHKLKLP